MNGFFVAHKPSKMTSSDAVVIVRRALPRGTAIGHGGTLDPDASGVLPLCVGKATRLFDYIIDKQKTYVARIQFGLETDTQDLRGTVLNTASAGVSMRDIVEVLPEFTGDIMQIPPMYSAIKKGGKRLYELARRGEAIEREPRKCRVDSIRLLEQVSSDSFLMEIACRKGVYIRTLCNDIGKRLGTCAVMAELCRTKAGIFTLDSAQSPHEIAAHVRNGRFNDILIPMDAPLQSLPRIELGALCAHAVKNGNPIARQHFEKDAQAPGTVVRIYLEESFAGIGEIQEDGSVRFRAMLLEER